MKKFVIVMLSLFVGLVSLSAVWEGNGIVGKSSEFSEDGMFVKSSIFPKYTLVEIANLENGSKTKAIVLEGEEREGILLSFSPSVARALKASGDSVVRIRVDVASLVGEGESEEKDEAGDEDDVEKVLLYDSKPISKQKDEGAISFEPSFVEDDESIASPIAPIASVAKSDEKKEDGAEKKSLVGKDTKKVEKAKERPAPPKTVSTPPKRPIYLEEVSMRPPKEVLPPKEQKKEIEKKVDEPVSTVEKVKDVENSEEDDGKSEAYAVGEVEGIKIGEEILGAKESEIEKVGDAPLVMEPLAKEDEKIIKDVGTVSPIKEREGEVLIAHSPTVEEVGQIEKVEANEEEIVHPVEEVDVPSEEEVQKDEDESEISDVAEEIAKTDSPLVEEEEMEEADAEEEIVAEPVEIKKILLAEPVYLVATNESPILEEQKEGEIAEDVATIASSKDVVSEKNTEDEPVTKNLNQNLNAQSPKEEVKKDGVSPANEVKAYSDVVEVAEDSNLFAKMKSGYSYVQIAVFASLPSAKEVAEKYGKQYPIILEKKGDNKYALLIGPLNRGEVGAIKERFKSFGFPDAYLK